MDDTQNLIRIACDQLNQGQPFVLASIIALQGSSPRHNGTKMIIDSGGRAHGTIGGSLMEATVINQSREALQQKQPRVINFELTGEGAYSKGMICGGKTVLLLDYLAPTQDNLELFKHLQDAITGRQNLHYLTVLKETADSPTIEGRFLLFPDGAVSGRSNLPEKALAELKSEVRNISSTKVIPVNHSQVVIDPIRKLKTLFCFGAGHVAVPTAHLASLVGFQVVVVDDRPEFADAYRFPDADRICVIKDFNQALDGLHLDRDSFIIILTRGHQFDRSVLSQALNSPAGYIGMISSQRKRDTIYQALMEEGFTIGGLQRVHSPIGVKIGAETPEEIAVSIVAELINERQKQG